MVVEGAAFLTLWVYADSDTALWIYGLLWSIGFLGFWAPSMILTAEIDPTRIRGVDNGFSWAVAWLVGFVLWPFVTIGIQQSIGSFAQAFLLVPVAMVLMGLGIWVFTPEHRGKGDPSVSHSSASPRRRGTPEASDQGPLLLARLATTHG